jgi:hypothetical protein
VTRSAKPFTDEARSTTRPGATGWRRAPRRDSAPELGRDRRMEVLHHPVPTEPTGTRRAGKQSMVAVLVTVAALAIAACSSTSSGDADGSTDATPTSSTPASADRCVTSGMSALVDHQDAGAGQRYLTIAVTNASTSPCTVEGYPQVTVLRGDEPIITDVRHDDVYPVRPILLQPSRSAYFDLHYGVVETSNGEVCTNATRATIAPPGDGGRTSLVLTDHVPRICPRDGASVSPFRDRSTI